MKKIKDKYAHVRMKLQKKERLGPIKRVDRKEKRIVNQQLHLIANGIITYAKQFSSR